MEKIVAANLKMNFTYEEVKNYIEEINKQNNDKRFIVFPTNLYLSNFVGHSFLVGSQNICNFEKGAYTGEVSANQIKSLGVDYTLIGHSERRKNFYETDEVINEKLKIALKNDLKVIVCIGETLEEREAGKTEEVLRKQILGCLSGVENISNIILAYEPVWAISSSGTGIVATNEDIYSATKFIKDIIYDKYSLDINVLYGGSVNDINVEEINKVNNISGVLVGGASLSPDKINRIKEVVLS